jgi:hypothetical protein
MVSENLKHLFIYPITCLRFFLFREEIPKWDGKIRIKKPIVRFPRSTN